MDKVYELQHILPEDILTKIMTILDTQCHRIGSLRILVVWFDCVCFD
jgi:hypothetical protein